MTELSHRVAVPSNSSPFCSDHGVQRSCTANVSNSTGIWLLSVRFGAIILHFVGLFIASSLTVILIFYPFSFRKSAPMVWLDMRHLSLCGSGNYHPLPQDKEYFNDAERWDPSTILFYSLVFLP
jgi:hypothetical protein